ncbi:4-hydroxybenzoate octaprenyltransferase [Litorimonas sp. RW-G-Af-16]|uniref:4-hydroxybenzoate octaprenyltransferase n=1 Tax=Litorimonas sp. RW-G-Af-16 TaxID=3241168 RepID=UPI00390CAD03
MTDHIKDASKSHWVYKAPASVRPYLQLSRLDRPVGYWLLTLPGWIGLAFASLSHGFAQSDLKWAVLILVGAIAMRGAGCTYNDIVDQDLDRQVDRTALRPLPAGTVTTKQAWAWLFAQCFVGLIVLLCLPRLAQIISLCSIPLVAAYPFMKRITWFPQVWLGMTFNWTVLVAYAAKTGTVSAPLFILYLGLIFWTVGYDTIYACQDIEDDAMIGIKSTARRFGAHVKTAVGICYFILLALIFIATGHEIIEMANSGIDDSFLARFSRTQLLTPTCVVLAIFAAALFRQPFSLKHDYNNALALFKSNFWVAFILISGFYTLTVLWELN